MYTCFIYWNTNYKNIVSWMNVFNLFACIVFLWKYQNHYAQAAQELMTLKKYLQSLDAL